VFCSEVFLSRSFQTCPLPGASFSMVILERQVTPTVYVVAGIWAPTSSGRKYLQDSDDLSFADQIVYDNRND